MKVIERIYQYIDFKGVSRADFERKNLISNGYLAKMYRRKADVGEGIMTQILENSPDLSPGWLLTGEGSMLKTQLIRLGMWLSATLRGQQATLVIYLFRTVQKETP